jgi:hypothetical protein
MERLAAPVDDRLTLSLDVRPLPLRPGADAEWELRLRNDGPEPVRLTFPTSQLGDVVLRRDGVERWRWSEGRMFLQVLAERELAPAEEWSFSLEGAPEVEPGRYEATATVCARPAPPPARTPVEVARR